MLKSISKTRGILPFVTFLHGMLLTVIFVLFVMSDSENELYDRLVFKFVEPSMSEQETVLALLHGTQTLLAPRHSVFEGRSYANIRDKLLRSADIQLNDAKWSCGSYVHVLGRLLQRAGFKIRIAQMKCGHVWGCHIVLETMVDGRFVNLDAFYGLAFSRPDGKLASFKELNENWKYYKDQAPENYEGAYAYEDVRYTNWRKIPYLMPAVNQVLKIVVPDRVETISIRSWVLNLYQTYMIVFGVLYLALLLLSARVLYLRKSAN